MPAFNGSYYYIVFLYAYSKYVWFYLNHYKSQSSIVFKSFNIYVEKKTNCFFSLKSIQTDNACEFLCLKSFLTEHGKVVKIVIFIVRLYDL